MFSEVNTEKPTFVKNGIRNLFATLDKAVYMLLGITYQIFFNIASAEIFSSGTITKFAQRIQLIIGVFVMFQLVMTIIRGIINPDSFTDSKSGAGNIVFRIATALVMLTLVIPFNLASVNNEFERKVSNNGLLFGTLYSLQYRILNNNTIGKLIMGTSEDSNYITSSDDSDLVKTSNRFVSSILKGFYRVNLVEDYKTEAGKEPAQIAKNRMCNNDSEFNKAFEKYIKDDVKPNDVIDTVDVKCGFASGKRYGFNYMPLVSLVIGILFTIIILSFCIDIATRAIKLGILQLLAPIPIISYMDPKGGKDGAFNSWIKMVVSTYLDLFVRVASVYLAIFIIQEMLDNRISMVKGGIIGVFTRIFIYVALFYFAKEAPKFIKQVLGIKDDGGGMFSGLGKVTGLGAVGAGVISGGISSGVANRSIIRGFGGAVSGGFNAGKELWNQKTPDSKALMNRVRANNAKNYANAADESTAKGRFIAGMQSNLGLKNKSQKLDDKIKYYGAATSAWKRINTALDSDDNKIRYAGPDVVDSNGNVLFQSGTNYSIKDAKDTLERMRQSGQYDESTLKSMEDAHKSLQKARFDDIRARGHNGQQLYGTEAQIYQGAQTIYEIGKKYSTDDDQVFAAYQNVNNVADPNLSMGPDFKGAAYNADRQVEAIKSSTEYAQAKADAQRVEESKK